MFLGKVIGSVWATKKTDNLAKLRFLLVHPINLNKSPTTDVVVVADILGAGSGETVICAYGHAARKAISPDDPSSLSIEAAVVGIVDRMDVDSDVLKNLQKTDKGKKQ